MGKGEFNTEHVPDSKKSHRDRNSGRKAEKKKQKKVGVHVQDLTDKQRNPKAFAFNSAVRGERRFRRKQDIDTKKQHIPIVDRTPVEPPPILVAIVGPPKVGKTTLMNNLIKSFTNSRLTNVQGPVTLVTGKKRRITFIECNNDINCMIDIAKVADLVLLLCDASFGFEMEIFEFLNICQVHGIPKIMGVLTHLDMLKNAKTLKRTKKTLKHRFWTEVYAGAKLFYLSGIHHGEYLKNEITNLARFISVMKFRPLTWRGTHSYLLADRMEDLTNPELIRQDQKCDRNVSLYGYVRGVPLNKTCSVHVAGVGDFKIHDVSFLSDPCPLPDQLKKRSLVEKERLIYAPFSGVGGIVYDKDAVYVDLGGSHSHQVIQNESSGKTLVENLIETKQTLDEKIDESEMQLFTNWKKVKSKDVKIDEPMPPAFTDVDETEEKQDSESKQDSDSEIEEEEDQDEDSDDSEDSGADVNSGSDDEVEGELLSTKWKDDIPKKARDAFLDRQNRTQNLMKLVYGVFDGTKRKVEIKEDDEEETNEDGEQIGGLFTLITNEQKQKKDERDVMDLDERSLFSSTGNKSAMTERDWLDEDNKVQVMNCFVTGKWKDTQDASELLKLDDMEDPDEDDAGSEIFGDFEDLETGEKFEAKTDEASQSNKRKLEPENEPTETLAEKKRRLKEKFDNEYDNKGEDKNTYYDDLKQTAEKQSQLNKTVFEEMPDEVRVQLEGYRSGMYVRIEFEKMPCEFVENFNPTYPIVIGGLNMAEENIGYVNVKIKKHRWYKKILKSKDPVIISMGWRRFQTMPLFAKLEDDLKYRFLKYTPEHVSCNANFWGPITPQATGFLAIQDCTNTPESVKQLGFRIAATGAVQELDKSTQIMKKLKLVGEPLKIFKKTAFIKNMFNSPLEVAKFEGAKIKTVSGIRGMIKKPVSKPEGCFRATFEDKIQLSDIVFCRTWFKVDAPQFYNPVTNLLLPTDQKLKWIGMKTTGQLKREQNVHITPNPDNLYEEIVRQPKVFKPLIIPKSLQKELPYRDKPKFDAKVAKGKGKTNKYQPIAVIREPHEQDVANMMKRIKTLYQAREEKLKVQTHQRMETRIAELKKAEDQFAKKLKVSKKQACRIKSKSKKKDT